MAEDQSRDERRRAERIRVPEPIETTVYGVGPALLLEIGLLGARIQTDSPLEEASAIELAFVWDEERIAFKGTVSHCSLQPALSEAAGTSIYHVGIDLDEADGNSLATLKRMITSHVIRALEIQKANAKGTGGVSTEDAVPFLDSSSQKSEGGEGSVHPSVYLSLRLDAQGKWHRTAIYKPVQPADGFTLPATFREEEIDQLCRSWETAGEDERKLLRAFAELALADDESVPPQRFLP
ncbi:MAG: hypothetical protein WBX15_15990 [Thermoanaerobaculia bacterium]